MCVFLCQTSPSIGGAIYFSLFSWMIFDYPMGYGLAFYIRDYPQYPSDIGRTFFGSE